MEHGPQGRTEAHLSDSDQPDFSDTPTGWANRWAAELKAAREVLEPWHTSAEKCIERYLDDKAREGARLNLFSGSINTREAVLYGNVPTVDVARGENDADDDDARVGGELLGRQLNGDIGRDDETYPEAIGCALSDWLKVGFGNVRLRYVRETEPVAEQPAKYAPDGVTVLAEAVPAGEQLLSEDVETDYYYWKDQLWSPARVFRDVRWWGFRVLLSDRTAQKTFGEKLPLTIGGDGARKDDEDKTPKTPWARAEVWEIWDKENKCVWWYAEGHPHVLKPVDAEADKNGSIPDPLGLKAFWPFPEPLFANLTTSKLIPRPDYALAQDIYEAIDDETSRIETLRNVVKASGVYDKTVGELADLLTGTENKLVPAQNYVALSEKGGIANSIAWLPLEAIVLALDKLRELRNEDIALLYQVTGDGDIIRGQATAAGATATEQAIKARFTSIRMDKAQRRFAKFASDAQRIRGEIIRRHFDPKTIAMRANAAFLPEADRARVPKALELLKSPEACYRIVVKPDAISLTDYAANKQESMDVLGTVGAFMQAVAPLAGQAPQIAPTLLKILQVFIARVKGGDSVEGILDEAIRLAQQAAANPPQQQPDPKLEAAKVKAEAEQFKAKADVAKTQLGLHVAQEKHGMDMQKMAAMQTEQQIRKDALKNLPGGPA